LMASADSSTGTDDGVLGRRLGLGSAAAVVVGEVIGIGIFLTPAGMAQSLGSPVWLFAVWLVMGGVTLAGALCFGALAARFPEAGGGYIYLKEAFGPRPAFLYGWMSLLVTDPGLTALLAVGMAAAVADAAGLNAIGVKAVAVGAILVVAGINMVGLALGAGLMRGLTVLKLGLLAFLAVWGFGLGRGDWSNLVPLVAQRPGSDPLPGALVGALIMAFFSFAGWWDMSKLTGEVRAPERTIPRALTLGVAAVTVVYVMVSLVFLYLVPTARITSDRAFAALAGEALFGRAGGLVFSSVVAITVLGSLAAFVMAAPRVYYAMARDGLFPHALAAIHPRFGTPTRATAVQAVLASVLVVTGTFKQILAYFFLVTVAFLWLTVAGVYVLHSKLDPARVPAPRVPGYPITPLLFLVPIGLLLVALAVENPVRSLLGLGVVLLGLPAYLLFFRRGHAPLPRPDHPSLP
jgi:basic amino acid/polyamine antiporter, APA family